MDEQVLTSADVQKRLRCCAGTVSALVKSGRLKGFYLKGPVPSNKRGKKGLRVLASSLDEYIRRSVAEMNPPTPQPKAKLVDTPMPIPKPTKRRRGKMRTLDDIMPFRY